MCHTAGGQGTHRGAYPKGSLTLALQILPGVRCAQKARDALRHGAYTACVNATESTALVHLPAPALDPARERRRLAAERAKRAARSLGQALWRGARWTPARVDEGYRAIDPDVRRTVVQAPLLGLFHVTPRVQRIEAKPDDGAPPWSTPPDTSASTPATTGVPLGASVS